MKIRSLGKSFFIASALLAGNISQAVDAWDTYSDTWVTVDGLGRTVNSSDDGLPTPYGNRTVGMFYFLSNGPHGTIGDPIYDITEILKANPTNPQFGPEGKPHWWAKPQLGYYVDTDPFVYDKHLQMLVDAGVDFLFMDVTNAVTYDAAVKTLMAAIDRRTAVGLPSPKLVYTVNSLATTVVTHLYGTFYNNSDYDKYWFYYGGRPLMLVDSSAISTLSSEIKDHFTCRHCWAWMGGKNPNEWGWLENYPQNYGWTYIAGERVNEQISVSISQHASTKIGRSYHNGAEPSIDAYAVCGDTPSGLYYSEQWKQALAMKAPIVMITGFNECMAGRFVLREGDHLDFYRPGGTPTVGESMFVDLYNAEFSRDIEPSTHPLIRDNYYLQTVANVRKYKGVRAIPTPSDPITITLDGDMGQWANVAPEFRDDIGDITHRDTQGFQNMAPMVNTSGRNDIVSAKVTKDHDNMYFYVKAASTFTNFNFSSQWMMLFINSDCNYSTGWNGYDYAVMKNGGKYYLMSCVFRNYNWQPKAEVTRYVRGNEMYFAIKRSDIGAEKDRDIDFKWADNTPVSPDILDFITEGDVAPNGRFNYRYKGSLVLSGINTVERNVDIDVSAARTSREEVRVRYNLPGSTMLRLRVYDMTGALLREENQECGQSGAITVEVPDKFLIVRVATDYGSKAIKIP